MPQPIDFVRILAVEACPCGERLIREGVDRDFRLVTSVLVPRLNAIGACLAETATNSTDTGTGQQADNLHRDDLQDGHGWKDHRVADIGPLGWCHSGGIHEDGGVSGRS